MLSFIDTQTDPYFNLSAEEYLLTSFDEPVFRLWRNEPCIVIGKYQNALAEINFDYVKSHKIKVVRRLSGGGAVFHDLGNLNFTFIDRKKEGEDTGEMFRRFTAPIIDALQNLGINAALEGRNDLTIDGRKFSGNAICIHDQRVLQHGTLLFSASMNNLSEALKTRPEKFIGKSVKSNISRVTNISEHLPDKTKMTIEEFIAYLDSYISDKYSGEITRCNYSSKDLKAIDDLRKRKYETDRWIYGNSPKYSFTNVFRLPCGLFEVSLDVRKGIITDCRIMGDYFFLKPTEDITNAMKGINHQYDSILSVLSRFDLKEYFGADIKEDLAKNLIK